MPAFDGEPDTETRVVGLPGVFNCTDVGNARRLVAKYRDKIRFCPPRGKWLLWDRTRWRWDDSLAIDRMAKETARSILREAAGAGTDGEAKALSEWAIRSEDAKRIKSMVSLAQSEAGIPIAMADLDADPWLLNCRNGTVDLRHAGLLDHDRTQLITRSTKIDYDPEAKSALWDRVLSEACGGDAALSAYIQRAVGYALIGLPLERAFFFLYGPPGTAKSTLIDAIHAALGEYVEEADFDTWLLKGQVGGNRGDLVRLAGARIVTSREARPGAKWDESLIKRITGGDPLTVCAKYENEVTYHPSFALIFAANDAPSAREDDEGFWVRMRRIPLTRTIPAEKQDKKLKQALKRTEHAQAILAWAVKGAAEYITKETLGECEAVTASTAEYRADLDHFGEFLNDCCVFEERATITRAALRKLYEAWGEEVNRKALLTAKQIAEKLRLRHCTESPGTANRGWVGIRERMMTDSRAG